MYFPSSLLSVWNYILIFVTNRLHFVFIARLQNSWEKSCVDFYLLLSGTYYVLNKHFLEWMNELYTCWEFSVKVLTFYNFVYWLSYTNYSKLPWWFRGKESAYQCRRHGFDPWVGKIPWRRKWQLTPISCLGNSMDRGAWRVIVYGVTKELDSIFSGSLVVKTLLLHFREHTFNSWLLN